MSGVMPIHHAAPLQNLIRKWPRLDLMASSRLYNPPWQVTGAIMYTNHSCVPNCRLEAALVGDSQAEVSLITLEDVPAGTMVTFDYNTTEWDMAAPFECLCGEPCCVGSVKGFRHLPPDRQQELMAGDQVLPAVREAFAAAQR